MTDMDLVTVMDGIAATVKAAEIPVLAGTLDRCYGWPAPPGAMVPPALSVAYPDELPFDATMRRGADRATFGAWLVLGNVEERSTRDLLSPVVTAIRDALNGTGHDWCRTARVQRVAITAAPQDGLLYLNARFDVDVLT